MTSSRQARAVLIREALSQTGMTKAQLARDSGVAENTLWSWLNGRRAPEPESLLRLAEGLDRRSAELAHLAAKLRHMATEAGQPSKVAGDDALGG